MPKQIAHLVLITLVPALELRASIPAGLGLLYDIYWPAVFVSCVAANIVLGIVWFLALDYIVPLLTKIKPVAYVYGKYVERTQHRIDKAVEKWGEWAVAVFIGIPLPGSGVYTGALAAYLIGLSFRKFMVANAVGVLIAGTIVTAISLLGGGTVEFVRQVFFLESN